MSAEHLAHPIPKRGGARLRGMPNVLRLGERFAGDAADADQDAGPDDSDETFHENTTGDYFLARRPPVA